MELNQSLYNSFRFHGSNTICTYLKKNVDNLEPADMQKFLKACHQFQTYDNIPPLVVKLQELIGKKAKKIFMPVPPANHDSSKEFTEIFDLLPPFEAFLNLDKKQRAMLFFTNVALHDVVVGKIHKITPEKIFFHVLCFAHRKRLMVNVDIAVKFTNNIDLKECILVKAAIKRATLKERLIYLTTEIEDLPAKFHDLDLGLGIITENDIPTYYKLGVSGSLESYSKIINKNMILMKLEVGNALLKNFNNDSVDLPSLFSCWQSISDEKQCANTVEKNQSLSLSQARYQEGNELFKLNKPKEALELFQQSLKYYPLQIEALMGCAAVFTLQQNSKKAIELYEKVLFLDERNERAKGYLTKNLHTVIKSCEEHRDYFQSFKNCDKLLKYDGKIENQKIMLRCLFRMAILYGSLPPVLAIQLEKHFADIKSNNSDMDMDLDTENGEEGVIEMTEPPLNVVPPPPLPPPVPKPANNVTPTISKGHSAYQELMRACQLSAYESSEPVKKLASKVKKSTSALPAQDAKRAKLDDFSNRNGKKSQMRGPSEDSNTESQKDAVLDLHKQKCDKFIEDLSAKTGSKSCSRPANEEKTSVKKDHSHRCRRHHRRTHKQHRHHRHHRDRSRRSHGGDSGPSDDDPAISTKMKSLLHERRRRRFLERSPSVERRRGRAPRSTSISADSISSDSLSSPDRRRRRRRSGSRRRSSDSVDSSSWAQHYVYQGSRSRTPPEDDPYGPAISSGRSSRVPLEPMSGVAFSSSAKEPAVNILKSMLDKSAD